MNWIPHILVAGQGDLSSSTAQELGHKYWQKSVQRHYIVDYAKYFSSLIALSDYLQVTQVNLRLAMLKADKQG